MTLSKTIKGLIAGTGLLALVAAGGTYTYFNYGFKISANKAQEIAYKNAGISKEDVSYGHYFREREGLRAVYDLDFNTANGEYNYVIDAGTGDVLSRDFESNGFVPNSTLPNQSTQNTTSPTTENNQIKTTSNAISNEQAENIALQAVNLEKSAVSNLFIHNDIDNGLAVIEVDFVDLNTGLDYDITIDANTGDIIEQSEEPLLD